jgi:hypothetical protein
MARRCVDLGAGQHSLWFEIFSDMSPIDRLLGIVYAEIGCTEKEKAVTGRNEMKQNVGMLDRTLRIVVGLFVLGAGLYFGNWLGLVGFVPLITGVIGNCPAYSMLGVSTCPARMSKVN